jgi:hypothetical protein
MTVSGKWVNQKIMKDTKTKESILKFIFGEIDKLESELLISSDQSKEVNDFSESAYTILEVARLALRGQYHTIK